MAALRVCLLTTSYPRFEGDVSGTFVRRLARELAKETEVTVVAPGDPHARQREHIDGLTVERFTYLWPRRLQSLAYGYGIPENLRRAPWRIWQVPFLMLGFFLSAFKIGRQADVFHANWIPTALACLPAAHRLRLPLVVSVRGTDARRLPSWLIRFTLGRVDQVIAFGAEAARLEEIGVNSVSIQTPIDTEVFHDAVDGSRAAASMGLDPHRPIISLIARLYAFKDPLTLVEAVPRALEEEPDLQFAIVGEGVLLDDVRARVRELGVEKNVAVPGPRSDVAEILAASTAFVAISPVENIWSATIAEATTMGIPCILTASGLTPSIFTNELDCLMIEPGDSAELARCGVRLVRDSRLRESLVSRCRELHRAHGHDPRAIVESHLAEYRSALARLADRDPR